ncbi:hypothetical protein [Streptomyces mirabilis]|uniref:hypothetical protein n=1 Tax=Streptomyces mirabilis TaxID=68239 RepID=UPI00331DD276
MRGSRAGGKTAGRWPAAALHGSQTVIAQRQVAAKSDEIPAFTPRLAHFGLRGVVVTADAMHHTQRQTVKSIAADGHYLRVVQGQPEEAESIKRRRVNTKTGKVRTKEDGLRRHVGWTDITPAADHHRSTASAWMPWYPW